MKRENFGDRERLEDMLMSEVCMCCEYNMAAMRSRGKRLQDEMTTLLYDEHRMKMEIESEMERRGFCDVEMAESTKIERIKLEYSAKLLGM